MKIFKSLIILTVITCLLACTDTSTIDKFYTEKGEWDSARLPFIKPYEAVITNKDFGWSMNLDGKDGDTGFFNIKKANIVDGIILIYSINSIFHGVDVKQSWHIIIPKKHIEKGFASYQEYRDYLNALGIKSEPILYDIEHIANYYEDHDTINWKVIK
jgi:hypothetical protein